RNLSANQGRTRLRQHARRCRRTLTEQIRTLPRPRRSVSLPAPQQCGKTPERCPSGRRGSPAKGVSGQKPDRGFESLSLRQIRKAPRKGRFAYLAEREVVDEPYGDSAPPAPHPSGHRLRRCSLRHPAYASDKIVWNIVDSRRLALERDSAEGFGPWMGQTIPPDFTLPRPTSEGVLRIWRREVVDEPSRVRQFCLEHCGQPQAGPGARSAEE